MKTPLARPAVGSPSLERLSWDSGSARDPNLLALDKNENVDPILKAVVTDVARGAIPASQNIYPESADLYRKLAKHEGVTPDQLCLAAGSDGAIRSVFEAFISPGDRVLRTNPTFAMYGVYIKMFGASEVCVEYQRSQESPYLDIKTLFKSISNHRPKLVCLPNPDSPSGTVVEPNVLSEVVVQAGRVGALCLIDEAYYPFYENTALPLLEKYDNLIIVRSTGKAWGMAGLRIGYAVSTPQIAKLLHKVKGMYETGTVAMATLSGMIDQYDEVSASVERILEGKSQMITAMRQMGFLTFAGYGNFLHVNFGDQSEKIHAALSGLVYYRQNTPHPCLDGFSRFSMAPSEILAPVIKRIKFALSSD